MANQDNTIEGLRTQILENWTFLRPEEPKPVIVISRTDYYEAIIAESHLRGKIYVVSRDRDTVEQALRDLLNATSEMISCALIGRRDSSGNITIS